MSETRCDDPHILVGIENIRRFVTAGRAIFTIRNLDTGNRVTYRVEKAETEGEFTVKAFTGSDNSESGHYSVLGFIAQSSFTVLSLAAAAATLKTRAEAEGDTWLVGFADSVAKRLAKGEKLSDRQESCLLRNLAKHDIPVTAIPDGDMKMKVFPWLWKFLASGKDLPGQIEVWHEGRCGRCGHRLTVPESIANGLGPVCAGLAV